MALNSPPSAEEVNLYLYKWKNKSESAVIPNDTLTVFTFEAKADVAIQNLTGIGATNPTPDIYTEDTTNGNYTYYHYDTGWKSTTGKLAGYDCRIYFRLNGVDYPVDGGATSVTSVAEGTTLIEVTFAQATTTVVADKIVLSYAYRDVTNPEPYEFCTKEFNPKYNGRDFDTVTCMAGKIFKRRKPLELTEIDFTVLKTSNSLSGTMLGEREVNTINSKVVRNVTGGNYVYPHVLKIKMDDPDDNSRSLLGIYRDLGTTSVDFSASVDSELEEKVTVKCVPEQTIELELDA